MEEITDVSNYGCRWAAALSEHMKSNHSHSGCCRGVIWQRQGKERRAGENCGSRTEGESPHDLMEASPLVADGSAFSHEELEMLIEGGGG